jgi:hypothetical protein
MGRHAREQVLEPQEQNDNAIVGGYKEPEGRRGDPGVAEAPRARRAKPFDIGPD